MDLAYSIALGLLGFAFSSPMDRIGIPSGFTLAYLSVIYISYASHSFCISSVLHFIDVEIVGPEIVCFP